MTADELKALPKGSFIVTKTGANPMRTRLRLFLDWGITFGKPYSVPEHSHRKVHYANKVELEFEIMRRGNCYELADEPSEDARNSRRAGGQPHIPMIPTEMQEADVFTDVLDQPVVAQSGGDL